MKNLMNVFNTAGAVWRQIPNTHYSADLTTGSIRNDLTGYVLRPHPKRVNSGRYYYTVDIDGRTQLVHRLVMSALLERVLSPVEIVRHLNGRSLDNREINLAVGTHSDNRRDRLDHGTYGYRLSPPDVVEIRLLSLRKSISALANEYGVCIQHIKNIVARKSWTVVE